ncbi:LacI family transcriptional regulator [Streptomyces sp. LBUM 1485]|nr:LacI family transcriptional regulator [Streptomyces sp. LBUM 1485]
MTVTSPPDLRHAPHTTHPWSTQYGSARDRRPADPATTQADPGSVATLAGVGRGTASRVINGSGNVSPAARTAVMEAVRELGYVPNQAARALVRRHRHLCVRGVVDGGPPVLGGPVLRTAGARATAELAAGGIQLLSAVAGPSGSTRDSDLSHGGSHRRCPPCLAAR